MKFISEEYLEERYFYVPGVSFAKFEINKAINNSTYFKCKSIKDKAKKNLCKLKVMEGIITKLEKSKSQCGERRNNQKCVDRINTKIKTYQDKIYKLNLKIKTDSIQRYRANFLR